MNKSQWAFWGVFGLTTVVLFYLLSPILMPFMVAALIAYLCDPLVDSLEGKGFSRTTSVVIVFILVALVIFLLIFLLVPIIETQIRRLLEVLPVYTEWLLTIIEPFLSQNFGIDPSVLEGDMLRDVVSSNWKDTGGVIRNAMQAVSQSGFYLLGWVANLALIPLIAFYLLRDWDRLVAYIRDLLPRRVEPVVTQLTRESDEVLSAFLRGQLSVMLALGIIYSIGLKLIGLEFSLLIGMIAGFVSFVPYLGLIIGILVAGLAVIFQTREIVDLVWVFLVFGGAQAIEAAILTPLLVGERIGLHPVTVIFAVMAGGQLFGFLGILLALPVAAIIAVIMRHLHSSYKKSNIYRLDIDL